MADYERMYHIVCAAMDRALGMLEGKAEAAEARQIMQAALLEAEEVYIQTCGEAAPPDRA